MEFYEFSPCVSYKLLSPLANNLDHSSRFLFLYRSFAVRIGEKNSGYSGNCIENLFRVWEIYKGTKKFIGIRKITFVIPCLREHFLFFFFVFEDKFIKARLSI